MHATRPEFARIRLAFGKSAYFRELPAATLDALAAASTLVRCPGGPLHGPNEAAETFWLVLEGSLIVSWPTRAAESVPVAAIGVGSFYCASSLVEGGMTVTEARAERNTVGAAMPSERFRAIARADPALARMLGASRSKVTEELRRLQDAGLLRIGYGRIKLLRCRGLSEIAGGWVPML